MRIVAQHLLASVGAALALLLGGSGSAAEAQARPTFCGYRCTQDCSGHRAGYRWAQRKRLTERRQCGGNSRSFIEGCWAYVEGCDWIGAR